MKESERSWRGGASDTLNQVCLANIIWDSHDIRWEKSNLIFINSSAMKQLGLSDALYK